MTRSTFTAALNDSAESIIKARPGPASGLADPQPFQDGGELGRRVIASAVYCERQRVVWQADITGGHRDGAGDQRRPGNDRPIAQPITFRPAQSSTEAR